MMKRLFEKRAAANQFSSAYDFNSQGRPGYSWISLSPRPSCTTKVQIVQQNLLITNCQVPQSFMPKFKMGS